MSRRRRCYSAATPAAAGLHERLAAPEQQYYYVNQGPTYTGPGNLAPVRTIGKVGLRLRPWLQPAASIARTGIIRHAPAPYHYGHRVLRRYY